MKLFVTTIAICISLNAWALDSTMKLTVEELRESELIARGGVDVTAALRVLQLQLGASGCYRPSVNTPDLYNKRKDYTFDISSDNCVVVDKSSKCEAGYTPRNMQPNPYKSEDGIVGENKYIVCLKSSPAAQDSSMKNQKTK